MPDPAQLPYVLQLLEDDSPAVRRAVTAELIRHGSNLANHLNSLSDWPNENLRRKIHGLLQEREFKRLRTNWSTWLDSEEDLNRLESGLSLLAAFQDGPTRVRPLSALLDKLAAEFRATRAEVELDELVQFLFNERGFKGARHDYFHPCNSNLAYVLCHRRGIPISLAFVLMLVAKRVGLHVEGCSLPGHFMARFYRGNRIVLVDCFNGGRYFTEPELREHNPGRSRDLAGVLRTPATADSMIARVLRNLQESYRRFRMVEQVELMKELLERLEPRLQSAATTGRSSRSVSDHGRKPRFAKGTIVRHLHYRYRGVIARVDPSCMASDEWYQSNRTQPPRDQPWYHVLVDHSDQETYVAESNLAPDTTGEPVRHPLVHYFFEGFEDGGYRPNSDS